MQRCFDDLAQTDGWPQFISRGQISYLAMCSVDDLIAGCGRAVLSLGLDKGS